MKVGVIEIFRTTFPLSCWCRPRGHNILLTFREFGIATSGSSSKTLSTNGSSRRIASRARIAPKLQCTLQDVPQKGTYQDVRKPHNSSHVAITRVASATDLNLFPGCVTIKPPKGWLYRRARNQEQCWRRRESIDVGEIMPRHRPLINQHSSYTEDADRRWCSFSKSPSNLVHHFRILACSAKAATPRAGPCTPYYRETIDFNCCQCHGFFALLLNIFWSFYKDIINFGLWSAPKRSIEIAPVKIKAGCCVKRTRLRNATRRCCCCCRSRRTTPIHSCSVRAHCKRYNKERERSVWNGEQNNLNHKLINMCIDHRTNRPNEITTGWVARSVWPGTKRLYKRLLSTARSRQRYARKGGT